MFFHIQEIFVTGNQVPGSGGKSAVQEHVIFFIPYRFHLRCSFYQLCETLQISYNSLYITARKKKWGTCKFLLQFRFAKSMQESLFNYAAIRKYDRAMFKMPQLMDCSVSSKNAK